MTDERSDANVKMNLCQVRKMRSEDVAGAASLHRLVFPEYFLTHMGRPFLERFYSEFVDRSGNYGFVAICDEELAGSIIGTLDYKGCFDHFYRRQFATLALTAAGRFIVDPYIRRHLASRMAHLRQAFRSVTARRQQAVVAAASPADGQAPAHLLSIGVHPDKRGAGLAERLVECYCDVLWQEGHPSVSLSVRPENGRAIAFYEKTGWRRIGSSPSVLHYTRPTRPRATGGGNP